ncbi:Uncharacterized protein FWK35_00031471, partial [Aphis craccivora]
EFNTVIHIITPSRFINISAVFLKRIYRLIGNILSFILEKPQKYKRSLFLDTDSVTISSMVYRGKNMLVMESKIQDGCRILLNCIDLLKLQDLEWLIFNIIKRKTKIHSQHFHYISISHVIGVNFTSQLQLYAAEHITQRWLDELEKDEEIPSYIPPMSPPSPNTVYDVNDHPFGSLNIRYIDENDGPYGPQCNITETSNFDVAGPYGSHMILKVIKLFT